MKNVLKIKGFVRGWEEDENGLIVPDSYFAKPNTITASCKAKLVQKMGNSALDIAIDNLFTGQDPADAAQDGLDGIASYSVKNASSQNPSLLFVTSINSNSISDNFIEFYGRVDATSFPLTVGSWLILGRNYNSVPPPLFFEDYYAEVTIPQKTIEVGRSYHLYWKITIS